MQDAQTLRRNFLWNTFGQLTYMLCQFLCGILVLRLAGEQGYGAYGHGHFSVHRILRHVQLSGVGHPG